VEQGTDEGEGGERGKSNEVSSRRGLVRRPRYTRKETRRWRPPGVTMSFHHAEAPPLEEGMSRKP